MAALGQGDGPGVWASSRSAEPSGRGDRHSESNAQFLTDITCSRRAIHAAMVGRIDPVVLFAILVASALATAQGVPLVREDAANVSFSYPDGSSLLVRLAGAGGDMARVTFVPSGANTSFLRYQGFIRTESLATDLVSQFCPLLQPQSRGAIPGIVAPWRFLKASIRALTLLGLTSTCRRSTLKNSRVTRSCRAPAGL